MFRSSYLFHIFFSIFRCLFPSSNQYILSSSSDTSFLIINIFFDFFYLLFLSFFPSSTAYILHLLMFLSPSSSKLFFLLLMFLSTFFFILLYVSFFLSIHSSSGVDVSFLLLIDTFFFSRCVFPPCQYIHIFLVLIFLFSLWSIYSSSSSSKCPSYFTISSSVQFLFFGNIFCPLLFFNMPFNLFFRLFFSPSSFLSLSSEFF